MLYFANKNNPLCCLQGWGNRIDDGDVDACFESGECDHVVEGVARMGGQDHFYLEPHGSITVPLENNEIKIYASTQVPYKTVQLAVIQPCSTPNPLGSIRGLFVNTGTTAYCRP